jgi:hypothetical protein
MAWSVVYDPARAVVNIPGQPSVAAAILAGLAPSLTIGGGGGGGGYRSFTPMKLYDFNTLAVGTAASSMVSFWGTFANGFGSIGDNSQLYLTNTKACQCSVQSGSDGGLGGGTGPNGAFGFGLNFGGATVAEGEELWANVRMYVPLGFSFATNTGFLKFLRFEQSGAGGKVEHFALNGGFDGSAGAGIQIGWNLGDENFPNPQPDTCKKTAGILSLGQWVSVECYMKASATAANCIRRLWINGVLQFEIAAGKNTKWLAPAGSYSTGTLSGSEPVLVNASSHLTDMMYFTYWNGNAPQTQSIWVQTVAFHKDSTTLPFADAFGNKLIGPQVF